MSIFLEQIVHRTDHQLLISPLGDELVMMDIENGAYLNINSVGAVIWEMLSQPILVKDILIQLLQQFDIEDAQCLKELLAFLETLEKNGLLQVEK